MKRKSKIILFIMPLLLIGAFFLDLFFKVLVFVLVCFILVFYNYGLFFASVKVLFGIFISILPFLISFLFTDKEGKIFYILGVRFYSFGVLKALNYLFNIWIFGLFSFVLIKVFDVFNFLKNNRFAIIFMAIRFYSEIIGDFIKDFRKMKFLKIIQFIDKKYVYFKNISRQSDES